MTPSTCCFGVLFQSFRGNSASASEESCLGGGHPDGTTATVFRPKTLQALGFATDSDSEPEGKGGYQRLTESTRRKKKATGRIASLFGRGRGKGDEEASGDEGASGGKEQPLGPPSGIPRRRRFWQKERVEPEDAVVRAFRRFLKYRVLDVETIEGTPSQLDRSSWTPSPPFFQPGEGSSKAVEYFVKQQTPALTDEMHKLLEVVDPVMPPGRPLQMSSPSSKRTTHFERGPMLMTDFFALTVDHQPFNMRIFPLPGGFEGEQKVEQYKKVMLNEQKVLSIFGVADGKKVSNAYHCYLPVEEVFFGKGQQVISLGPSLKMPSVVFLYPSASATLGQVAEAIKLAAQQQGTALVAQAALLHITLQLIKLVAITTSKGILLRRLSLENFLLRGDGVVFLSGFSELVNEKEIFYETEDGTLVTQPPTRTSRGRRFTPADNSCDLGLVIFSLWCNGSPPEREPSGWVNLDFSSCESEVPVLVQQIICGLCRAHGYPPQNAFQTLGSHEFKQLRQLYRDVEQRDEVHLLVE
ncbi:rhoptry kinase family protein ROP40 (incomplete catalytic triad) [Toxoplasma gondii p89]|uniref:Rhoptry kinase family protein ROP40 (Incomplete catalytic triad) n=1 Tax=Toxoplasma gondii p89 TaxID=943119 RepID=A0A086JFE5_TOXGO|nr:rhoptry kinase family protein ROP40 (incomplete catalytic triad) [Toxoplasma gondii p89]